MHTLIIIEPSAAIAVHTNATCMCIQLAYVYTEAIYIIIIMHAVIKVFICQCMQVYKRSQLILMEIIQYY